MQILKALKPSATFVAVQNPVPYDVMIEPDGVYMYSNFQERTVNDPSLQCRELDGEWHRRQVKKKRTKFLAYDKRLIKGEHNNKLDGQKFSQWTPSFKFFMCKAIEHQQTVKCKAK